MTKTRDKVIISKSNKGIFVQLVLMSGETKIGQRYMFDKSRPSVEQALEAGENFGKKIEREKIKLIVFDRAKNLYHGQVKAFADGLRKTGLQF